MAQVIKSAVVIGGCGMVGTQLVKILLEHGIKVLVLDNLSRGSNRVDGAHYIVGDATNDHTCRWVFRNGKTKGKPVDAVFNLSATVAGVLYNQSHQVQMFHENVVLASVPAMVAAEVGVRRYLYTSSVCVYAPEHQSPAKEPYAHHGEPHGANAGYSWSKRMGERVTLMSGIERVVIVRPTNILGPFDYYDERAHVVPALVRKALEDPELNVYGSYDIGREFIHSADVARGMFAVMSSGRNREAYNLGCDGDNTITVGELVSSILNHTGKLDKPVVWHGSEGGGDPVRSTDCSKVFADTGWRYQVPLDEAIKDEIKWYEENKL